MNKRGESHLNASQTQTQTKLRFLNYLVFYWERCMPANVSKNSQNFPDFLLFSSVKTIEKVEGHQISVVFKNWVVNKMHAPLFSPIQNLVNFWQCYCGQEPLKISKKRYKRKSFSLVFILENESFSKNLNSRWLKKSAINASYEAIMHHVSNGRIFNGFFITKI